MMSKEFLDAIGKEYFLENRGSDKYVQTMESIHELCVSLVDMLNTIMFDPKSIILPIYKDAAATRNMSKICACWLRVLAYQNDSGCFDERNKYSTRIGKFVSKQLPDFLHDNAFTLQGPMLEKILFLPSVRKVETLPVKVQMEELVAFHMFHTHRSLQQAFSSLVFTFLRRSQPTLYKLEKQNVLVPEWYICPSI